MTTEFPVTISVMGASDRPHIHRMLADLALDEQEHYDHPRQSEAEIVAGTSSPSEHFVGENIVLVARERDGGVVGLCWCVLFDPGNGLEAELAELYVRPRARGRGVATALCRSAVQLFRERNVTLAVVWTRRDNAGAIAAYTSAGFAATDQMILTWLPLDREPASPDADGPDPPDRAATSTGDNVRR